VAGGKSDLVLRLIAAGAVLVADDRVDLFVRKGVLHARPPANIAGLLEIRGLGIVELPHAKDVRIELATMLARRVERLPEPRFFAPKGLNLAAKARPPLLGLVAFDASAPAKIAAAAAAFARGSLREFVKPQ
jgi:serine kinase of HPr protein (carbohydrate metabolism regulator)